MYSIYSHIYDCISHLQHASVCVCGITCKWACVAVSLHSVINIPSPLREILVCSCACPQSLNELVGRAPLRWSPLLVSCCWVRLLKACCQWLARGWRDSPLHLSLTHLISIVALSHSSCHPSVSRYLEFLPFAFFFSFPPLKLRPVLFSLIGLFFSFLESKIHSSTVHSSPLFLPLLFSPYLCPAPSLLSPPAPSLSSVLYSLPVHSVNRPHQPDSRYISHISNRSLCASLYLFGDQQPSMCVCIW